MRDAPSLSWSTLGLLVLVSACGGRSFAESPSAAAPDGGTETRGVLRGCPAPRPLSSGLEQCSDGVLHRTGPATCEAAPPRPPGDPAFEAIAVFLARGAEPARFECLSDLDCDAQAYGSCTVDLSPSVRSSCTYGCRLDDECGRGRVCACGERRGECVPGGCVSDASCAAGFACTEWRDGCDGYGLSCESAGDECRTASDCGAGLTCGLSGAARRCVRFVGCPPELD